MGRQQAGIANPDDSHLSTTPNPAQALIPTPRHTANLVCQQKNSPRHAHPPSDHFDRQCTPGGGSGFKLSRHKQALVGH